jgi:AcrR family transcriptional regulator
VLPELPLVGTRRERGDAAANRERVLCAARRLLSQHGPAAVSMDAVAAAAGVGKGTVFRRFGDRAGLMHALVDEYMREFQDAFISGPPPLGPGALPSDRLQAFAVSLVELQREHLAIALAAELAPENAPTGAYGALHLHARSLISAIDPAINAEVAASMLLGAISPAVLHRLQASAAEIEATVVRLLDRLAPDP